MAKGVIKVYSDGSAIKGKVGAAALLTCKDHTQRILHYHLGPKGKHTVHKAKLIGILLAIQLVKMECAISTPIVIGADNQAALAAFTLDLKSPAHSIAREILHQATCLQKHKGHKKHPLVLQWTAGHIGILGNERADEEAKRAVGGKTSDKSLLPSFLRCTLTINPSAIKQEHNKEINTHWENVWRSSVRGQGILKIDNCTPSAHLLRTISITDISHRMASIITQLCIAHVPLNKFLAKINKVDIMGCPSCGTSSETVMGQLAGGQENHWRWRVSVLTPRTGRAI